MPRAAHPAPRHRDAERSRSAILDAAAVLFAEQGYLATSLAAVGVRAGLSRGTRLLLRRQGGTLPRRAGPRLRRCARHHPRRAAPCPASGRPPADVLAGAVGDYLDFVAAHPAFLRLLQARGAGEGAGLGAMPLGQAVGSEAVAALAQMFGFPARSRTEVMHFLLSLIALTWFPALHGGTLVPAIGLDPPRPPSARRAGATSPHCSLARCPRAAPPSPAGVPDDRRPDITRALVPASDLRRRGPRRRRGRPRAGVVVAELRPRTLRGELRPRPDPPLPRARSAPTWPRRSRSWSGWKSSCATRWTATRSTAKGRFRRKWSRNSGRWGPSASRSPKNMAAWD